MTERTVTDPTAETLRLLAQCITAMAEAIESGDEILGSISGQGIANHLPALPKHVRDVFMEYLDDDAARGVAADRAYWVQVDGGEATPWG